MLFQATHLDISYKETKMTNEEIRVEVEALLARFPVEQRAFRIMKLQAQYPDVDLVSVLSGDGDD